MKSQPIPSQNTSNKDPIQRAPWQERQPKRKCCFIDRSPGGNLSTARRYLKNWVLPIFLPHSTWLTNSIVSQLTLRMM